MGFDFRKLILSSELRHKHEQLYFCFSKLGFNCSPMCWVRSMVSSHGGSKGFPSGASGKESTCQCRRPKRQRFNPWVGKTPWSGSLQCFLPGKFRRQRSLVGYSPWGHKESDVTEHLVGYASENLEKPRALEMEQKSSCMQTHTLHCVVFGFRE